MSYKFKSLLYLICFITSSVVYQNYLDFEQLPTIADTLNSLELSQMKDSITSTTQVGVLDFNQL